TADASRGRYPDGSANFITMHMPTPGGSNLPDVPPMITRQPQSQTVEQGRDATFTVEAVGTTPMGFRWRREGAPFSDGVIVSTPTSSSLTVTNVPLAYNGNRFTVVVSNSVA